MKRILAFALFGLTGPALAVPGGPIGQLARGEFRCEQPGDATGAVGLRVIAEDFAIINANTYANAMGQGSYLLTGDLLTLTSGPKNGDKFHRISDSFLRKLDSGGKDTTLRCVRRVANNS